MTATAFLGIFGTCYISWLIFGLLGCLIYSMTHKNFKFKDNLEWCSHGGVAVLIYSILYIDSDEWRGY